MTMICLLKVSLSMSILNKFHDAFLHFCSSMHAPHLFGPQSINQSINVYRNLGRFSNLWAQVSPLSVMVILYAVLPLLLCYTSTHSLLQARKEASVF